MLQNCNPKLILGSCLFLNIGSLFVFTVTEAYPLLAFCRMCTGLFQVFFCIYFPVWADVFGTEIQKSQWLTYLLIASPLGVIMGYGMTAVFLDNIGWRWAFYIQSILLLPSMVGIVLIPFEYFDVQGTTRKMREIRNKEKKLTANVEAVSPISLGDGNQEQAEDDLEVVAEA